MPYNSIYMNITATYCMSSSTKTFNEIFLKVIVGYLLAKADEWSAQFLDTCTVAQGQLISFLKLLLSSCKDNRVEHWVSCSLLHHFRKKRSIIFLIKSVFCEHANKKEKKYNSYVL